MSPNLLPIIPATTWNGFVICGDNLDRNIKLRHQSLEARTLSLHCFNFFAVKDRCSLSPLSNSSVSTDNSGFDVKMLLPDEKIVQDLI
jgi:hypothetical protein